MNLEYVIIRSKSAGCFAGLLASRIGQEVELQEARRLWYWDGAASLSQLALEGTTKPQNCKFPPAVPSITIMEVIEIIPVSHDARISIESVKPWRA